MGPDDGETPERFLDVTAAAVHLDVNEAFIRRIVLEKRVRYYKVGKFLRFRPSDLDAFIEAGRTDPVHDGVHKKSTRQRRTGRRSA